MPELEFSLYNVASIQDKTNRFPPPKEWLIFLLSFSDRFQGVKLRSAESVVQDGPMSWFLPNVAAVFSLHSNSELEGVALQ